MCSGSSTYQASSIYLLNEQMQDINRFSICKYAKATDGNGDAGSARCHPSMVASPGLPLRLLILLLLDVKKGAYLKVN